MTGDSSKELHMTSDREGELGLSSPRRHGTGALPAPATTMLWLENTLTTQAMMMVPPWLSHLESSRRQCNNGMS
jgi:hypothetical protein